MARHSARGAGGIVRAGFLAAALTASASAQTMPPDCTADTLSPDALAACAGIAVTTIRAELDETYRLALVRAEAFDTRSDLTENAGPAPLRDVLERAQTDWTAYARSACAAEALQARDETPLTGQLCYVRLAERRIVDLSVFGTTE